MAPAQSKPVVEESLPPSDLQEAAAFPLMRLPSEIRLLVLEHLLQDFRYALEWEDNCCAGARCCGEELYLSVSRSVTLEISIFHVCSRLRHEALTVLQQKTWLQLDAGWSVTLAEAIPYLHPLLVQNVSRIRMDGYTDDLVKLLDTFPRFDTLMIEIFLIFDPNAEGLDLNTEPVGEPDMEPSSGDYQQTKILTLAKDLKCRFERGPDLSNPAEDFKFNVLHRPDNLPRPLKVLLGVDFYVGGYPSDRYGSVFKINGDDDLGVCNFVSPSFLNILAFG